MKDEEGEEERRTRPRSLEAALSPLPSPIGEREVRRLCHELGGGGSGKAELLFGVARRWKLGELS